MNCPFDQQPLVFAQPDVFACRRCQGRVFVGEAFSEIYPGIRELLVADDRGGQGRRSACPKCRVTMQPMRIGRREAWIDACDACELLWVERLNEHVVRGLKERWKREDGVRSLRPADRAELAQGLAAGTAEHEREMRLDRIAAEERGNYSFTGGDFIAWLLEALFESIDFD